ncbi:class IIb bacteriocin, lactobin A/cerein 7B family [Bacillus mycoides]|nr:class IIb bacteriocin, lactobin A/cerein 7B family [Bacillus mycoides]
MTKESLSAKMENVSVEELSFDEAQQIDGGIVPFLVAAGYVTAGGAVVGVGYAGGKWVGKHIFK